MMMLMKKFVHTSMWQALSPSSTQKITHSICVLHSILPCHAPLLLFSYMATSWNLNGGVMVKNQRYLSDPPLLSVASLIGSDGNVALIKRCYPWKLKSQISLTLPIARTLKIHLTVDISFLECLLKILTSHLQKLILEQWLLEHGGITTNRLKKILWVNLRLALHNRPCPNP